MRPGALGPALFACAVILGGCAGAPPVPAWDSEARSALDGYQAAYFAGNTRLAEAEFVRARRALSATARPELMARAELVRCALRTASLDFDDCPGYGALAADATGAERAYAAWLAGTAVNDASLLPETQRAVMTRGPEALASIQDPRARLVAAGVLLRQGRIDPAGIGAAITAASDQGWRRPLLAWLEVERKRAEAAGDLEAVARLARRIALAAGQPTPGGI